MSEAMITGVVSNRLVAPSGLIVSDPNPRRREYLQEKLGVKVTGCNVEAVDGASTIVFANKPQHCPSVFSELRGRISEDSLVVSICAGVASSQFQEGLNHDRIVRTMPNTPAMVLGGMTVWYAMPGVSEGQHLATKQLLRSFGKEEQVAHEDYLDMATALSGSGPAYFFLLMECLVDAGVHMGFPRDVADRLVRQTALGTAAYAEQAGGTHLSILRNDITSPGGTTAAALYAADRGNFRTVVSDAVWSAFERSKALNDSTDLKRNRRP
jgi:pyrroline-5-carboxylate reductase